MENETKILIVDDDPTTRKMLCAIVEKCGFHPIQASDGLRALSVLEDNPDINFLVTDFQMPQLDGRDLVEKARKLERSESLQIIMVSGIVSLSEISDLLEEGVRYFVPKPIDPKEFQHYLRSLRQCPSVADESLHV